MTYGICTWMQAIVSNHLKQKRKFMLKIYTRLNILCYTRFSSQQDNNWLGLSASLLAGEIAFRGYFSKDTTPLGPTRQQQTQVLLFTLAPQLPHWKSASPAIPMLLLFSCKQENQTM